MEESTFACFFWLCFIYFSVSIVLIFPEMEYRQEWKVDEIQDVAPEPSCGSYPEFDFWPKWERANSQPITMHRWVNIDSDADFFSQDADFTAEVFEAAKNLSIPIRVSIVSRANTNNRTTVWLDDKCFNVRDSIYGINKRSLLEMNYNYYSGSLPNPWFWYFLLNNKPMTMTNDYSHVAYRLHVDHNRCVGFQREEFFRVMHIKKEITNKIKK